MIVVLTPTSRSLSSWMMILVMYLMVTLTQYTTMPTTVVHPTINTIGVSSDRLVDKFGVMSGILSKRFMLYTRMTPPVNQRVYTLRCQTCYAKSILFVGLYSKHLLCLQMVFHIRSLSMSVS